MLMVGQKAFKRHEFPKKCPFVLLLLMLLLLLIIITTVH